MMTGFCQTPVILSVSAEMIESNGSSRISSSRRVPVEGSVGQLSSGKSS
jgi:hypothetical protein